MAEGDRLGGVFDATKGQAEPLAGLIALHPRGERAYLLGSDCRLREWDLGRATVTERLAAHSRAPSPSSRPAKGASAGTEPAGTPPECDPWTFRDAAVTPDGKWLTTRAGRWNLATYAHRALPFPAAKYPSAPAVSPDGRYAARVDDDPAVPPPIAGTLLVLLDLDTGARKVHKMGTIVNSDPLTFGASPLRVCTFDYGVHAFEVPSLREYQEGDPALLPGVDRLKIGSTFCTAGFVQPARDAHADLRARLASRVCSVGGLPVPVEHCGGSR